MAILTSAPNNVLIGGNGDDILGRFDADVSNDVSELMRGNGGNDTYFVDKSGFDSVIELPGEGTDWVMLGDLRGVDLYMLPDDVENLEVFTRIGTNGGVVRGNALDNILTSEHSGALFDLDGGAGNDTVIGSGRLYGGGGNDLLRGAGELWGDATTGSRDIAGIAGNDTLTASPIGNDNFLSGDGQYLLAGAVGGNDVLTGSDADSELAANGRDVLYGDASIDMQDG
ncbi:MAG: hypothetical protein ABL996_22580, partial [Micropepsaceae bacterium]